MPKNDLESLLEKEAQGWVARIEEAAAEVHQLIETFREDIEALAQLEASIGEKQEALTPLSGRMMEAVLKDDAEEQDRIRGSYQTLTQEIETLTTRRDELAHKLNRSEAELVGERKSALSQVLRLEAQSQKRLGALTAQINRAQRGIESARQAAVGAFGLSQNTSNPANRLQQQMQGVR